MKYLAFVIIILIGFIVWRFVVRGDALFLLTANSGKQVTAKVKQVIPNTELIIEIDNNSREHHITEISMPRVLAMQLGVTKPIGFKEEVLPLTEEERIDKETVDFVKLYNKENIRWVGDFSLPPDAKIEITFPAADTSQLAGTIQFQYEAKLGFSGSIAFFRVDLAKPQSDRTSLPVDHPNSVTPG